MNSSEHQIEFFSRYFEAIQAKKINVMEDIEITSTHKKEHPKGNSYKVFFTYNGEKYVQTYNSGNGYGFKFISFQYSGEILYSTTQPELNTELGSNLEWALSKMNIEFK